ncbi:SusE domain-containing protein [Psychroserpens algicola]|uniref:SusE domain-containing protein n=1 Tax=Psychroserpens algicola TaxID=1719034 RepID=UPI00195345E0|nr:SusE domain-containing protein [Psychroserpens algicola]
MKKILKFKVVLFAVLSLGFLMNSCEDDTSEFTATPTQAITLADLPITMIELDATNPGNPAITFNWNEADYNQQASENYTVLVSSDEAFTNPITATSVVGTTSATLSVNELNSAAGAAGLPPFTFSTLYAKVESSIGTQNGLPVSSNTINFQVQPYFNYVFDDYYLVGNGTSADWNNNNNNPPLFRDAENGNLYTYTGFFTKGGGGFDDGRFKILEVRGQWQPQWGVAADEGSDTIEASGDIAGNPATQDNDPGRFGVASDGYYTFTINFSSNTYTMNPFNDAGATTFTSMTLQGSGVGSDTAFTQSSFDSHLWYISSVNLQPGDLQIMTNAGTTWAGSTSFSGVATEGGDSIPVVVQDDYEVWFNDLTGDYIMIPLNL